jgi:hypothetical protein
MTGTDTAHSLENASLTVAQVAALWDVEPGYLNTSSYGPSPRPAWDALQRSRDDWRAGRTSWDPWSEALPVVGTDSPDWSASTQRPWGPARPFPTFGLKDGPGVNPANVGRRVPHGAILKVVTTNICGSDQHVVRGRTTAPEGLVLGREISVR